VALLGDDKDYASSLLARESGRLVLISMPWRRWRSTLASQPRWVDRMTVSEAKEIPGHSTHFAKGSMAPKMQADPWSWKRAREALVTNPENIGRALRGETGTGSCRIMSIGGEYVQDNLTVDEDRQARAVSAARERTSSSYFRPDNGSKPDPGEDQRAIGQVGMWDVNPGQPVRITWKNQPVRERRVRWA